MEASITPRKQTSLRLRVDLLERLKAAAQSANSSLNSYIEGILMDDVYRIPNKNTIEALREVKSGKYCKNKPIDTSSTENFINSILG
jgi:predicted DNA-binding protein